MNYLYTVMQSPLGSLKLVGSDKGLAGVLWENDREARTPHLRDATQSDKI
jgi:methylated-DNA-[protein]-cysteine S-methyltransferase